MCKFVLADLVPVDIAKTADKLLQTNRCTSNVYLYQVSQQFSGVGNLAFDVLTFVKQVLAVCYKGQRKRSAVPNKLNT